MSLAQGNNTPTRPRIEPGSPDPESDALTTRPVRSPCKSCVYRSLLLVVVCQEIYQLLYLCNVRCVTMSFRTDSSRASWSMKFRSSKDIMNLKHGIQTTELLFFANKFISPPFSRSALNCLSSSGLCPLFIW